MSSLFTRRAALLAAATLSLGLAGGPGARGAEYPSKPITTIVPYPPGATNDNSARIIAQKLSQKLGQPVVIENKAGAGGTLGADYVAKAAPDGYTLLNASSGNLSTAPQLIKTSYDPFSDLVPVGFIGSSRSVIAVHPSVPVKTLQELVTYAKANPGKLNFGSAGNGTAGHIAGEYLKLNTGIDMVHVPYRGSAAAVNDTVAGLVQLLFDPIAATYVKAGRLRGLAYYGADTAEDLPGVQRIDAAGFPEWELSSFFFTAAPARTPAEIVAKLSAALKDIAVDPDAVKALKAIGVEPRPLAPDEIATRLRHEHDVNGRVIKTARVKAD